MGSGAPIRAGRARLSTEKDVSGISDSDGGGSRVLSVNNKLVLHDRESGASVTLMFIGTDVGAPLSLLHITAVPERHKENGKLGSCLAAAGRAVGHLLQGASRGPGAATPLSGGSFTGCRKQGPPL